ncbi:MAG TPA: HU family DNA-binding protein [Firmicutes bacterium]|nr:HU family DNA-binding protein [Bacillota bacterium]
MGKLDLVKIIAQKLSITQKESSDFLNAFIETIEEKLIEGDKVRLVGFGTFLTRKRESREGRKPSTGEKIIIPASIAPAFKPGKRLKEKLNS